MLRLPRLFALSILALALPISALAAKAKVAPNFGVVVESGIYRGGQPDEAALARLKAMGVRTILKLNTRDVKKERSTCERLGLELIHIPTKPESIARSKSCADVDAIMSVLTDHTRWPIYVHCEHGRDRTGYVVGLYRLRVEEWSWAEIDRELKSYGHTRSKRKSYPWITRSLENGAKSCE